MLVGYLYRQQPPRLQTHLTHSASQVELAPVEDQVVVDSVLTGDLGNAGSRFQRLLNNATFFCQAEALPLLSFTANALSTVPS